MNWILYLLLGVFAGVYGGFFGLGAGTLVVPSLVFFFHFTQHQAQGTALGMMVPPVCLLAALRYYYSGNLKISIALLLAVGFFIGAFLGAHLVQRVPDLLLRRLFGSALLLVSIKMILGK